MIGYKLIMFSPITLDAFIDAWRQRLGTLIDTYERIRQQTNSFWLKFFLIFFLLNLLCYQVAIMTAFPDRAFGANWLRYALIQFPVGVLGAAFDCASMVVTVAIMRHAIQILAIIVYFGHVVADILIAVLATGWVLIVFSISTVLVDFAIGPPTTIAPASLNVIAQPRTVIAQPRLPEKSHVQQPVAKTPIKSASILNPEAPATAPKFGSPIDHTQFMANRSRGYAQRFSAAINDPFSSENIKNIYFGIVMGVSAMLPSLVHLFLGLASLLAVVLRPNAIHQIDE